MGGQTGSSSEQLLGEQRALIESSGLAVVGLTKEGNISSWNQGAVNMFGYKPDQIVGKEYALLLPEDGRGELNKALQKILRGRTVPDMETRRCREDGSLVDVIFSIFPVAANDGSIIGAVTTAQDITARKKVEQALQESTSQIQAIVNTIVDGLITINAEGIISAFNPGATNIFQYRAHEVIGRNVSMLMPEPYHTEHDSYIENYLNTGEAKVIGIGREVTGLRKDGTTFPMYLAISELKLSTGRSFVGIVRDVTERHEAERALREQMHMTAEANEELESTNEELVTTIDELESTNELLRETQGQLVESEKMASLGGLVAGVAHEINTPLGIGLSAASHLQDQVSQLSESFNAGTLKKSFLQAFCESSDEAAGMVLDNLRRASELIGSFKQVAADQTSSERREFYLKEYLQEVLTSLQPLTHNTAIEIGFECPDAILMNSYPGALAQVVTNLLNNAFKHGFDEGQAGKIDVSVQSERTDVLISCRDNGKGISAEHQSRIFEPFFTTARSRGGIGLGLSVSYNLVAKTLGGHLTMEKGTAEGACFVVRIPIEAPQG